MIFEMPPKIALRITDGTVRLTAGRTELALDQPDSGGTVTILAGRTSITLKQDGDVVIEAAGAMALKARGDLTLEGLNVTIKGTASSTLQGGTVSVKGMTSFSP
jgi:hypothetical protein